MKKNEVHFCEKMHLNNLVHKKTNCLHTDIQQNYMYCYMYMYVEIIIIKLEASFCTEKQDQKIWKEKCSGGCMSINRKGILVMVYTEFLAIYSIHVPQ